jgi:hypothetical protein
MAHRTSFARNHTSAATAAYLIGERNDHESTTRKSSSSLRSCVKKQRSVREKQTRAAGRHVHFRNEHEKKTIERVGSNLWVKKSTLKKSCLTDYQTVKHNQLVHDYLYAYELAHLEVKSGQGSVSKGLQQMLIKGAKRGYRALERYHLYEAGARRETRRHAVTTILSHYRRLSPTTRAADGGEQLRKHSKRLTRQSRQWAFFWGQIDAKVASAEYATLPSALLILWTQPQPVVVGHHHQQQQQQHRPAMPRLNESPTDRSKRRLLTQERRSRNVVTQKSEEADDSKNKASAFVLILA